MTQFTGRRIAAAALLTAATSLAGCEGAEMEINGQKGVPLADVVLTGTPPSEVVLASGDPFWFGAGGSLAAHLQPGEWVAHPAPSTFSLAASRLAWRLEAVHCFGLHAAPFARTRSALHPGAQLLCLLRDAAAVGEFAQWLTTQGCGATNVWVLEALGVALLTSPSLGQDKVLAALLAYRALYYFVPLVLASLALGAAELRWRHSAAVPAKN